jgi:hypothetical protein
VATGYDESGIMSGIVVVVEPAVDKRGIVDSFALITATSSLTSKFSKCSYSLTGLYDTTPRWKTHDYSRSPSPASYL